MIIQLNPQLPVVTPKGKGYALFLTDYGIEHDHMWTVAINETGELWSFFNREVKMEKNITIGRTLKDCKEYHIGLDG